MPKKTKELKFWNGRAPESLGRNTHGYIAAYSQAEAIRLGKQAFGASFSRTELTQYWNPCWGNAMKPIQPEVTEPGVWVTSDHGRRVWHLIAVNERETLL